MASSKPTEVDVGEVALTLAAVSEHLQELKQFLAMAPGSSIRSDETLTSTHYDSDDQALCRHGLGLSIHEAGGTHVQTVKSIGLPPGDPLSQDEWAEAIAGDQPDLTTPAAGPRLGAVVAADRLRPLFTTSLRRTIVELESGAGGRIEAVIDDGEIRDIASDAAAPLCEIALKGGDRAALYGLALRLLEVAPLRIETRSTPERGHGLILPGGWASPMHAKPVALSAGMTAECVLQAVGRGCVAHLLRNEPAVLAGQAEGIHQMRVAARRLRAALSALKPMIPPEQHQWYLAELKWLADALAPARNWDVFAAELVRPVERALPVEAELKRLAEAAEQRRRSAYEQAREAVTSRRYAATLLKLAHWLEVRGWRDQPASEQAVLLFAPIGEVAPALIERRWRRARKRSRRFGELSHQQRHKLRISLKKLRYTIEFLEDLFDGRAVKALEKQLKPLQEDLGRFNDVRTAHRLVEEVSRHVNEGGSDIGRAGGIVLGWHDRGLSDREPKLRRDVSRLRRAKPFWPRSGWVYRLQVQRPTPP
jgi:triphosphatase